MSIRFYSSPGDFYFRVQDSAAMTFPDGDWVLAWQEILDGSLAGTDVQYSMCFGTIGTTGSVNIGHAGVDLANGTGGKIIIYTTGSAGFPSARQFTSGQWQFVLARTGGDLVLYACPILSQAPVDGSAVAEEFRMTTAASATNVAMDGISGLFLGRRNDNNRKFNNSLARVFRYDGTITPHEIAQLAYGMEITDLGKTPAWYFRLNDPSDISDRGSAKLSMTKVGGGTPTAGAAPTYGYDSSNPPSNVAPSIAGTPVINEDPVAGQSVTYTRAPVSGIPTPVVTQQWMLDGVDVAGATGVSFTLPLDANGDGLSVRQIASSVAGTASATSAARAVAAPIANGVAAVAMPAEGILPRLGTSLAVPMSGTYTGDTPASIEYQLYDGEGLVVIRPWAAMPSPTIGSGSWAASPVVPQGGMYRRRVRTVDAAGNVLATGGLESEVWGVGALFGTIGSSSAALLYHANSGKGLTPRADVRVHSSAGWAKFGTDGAAIILANYLAELLGVPVGLLNYGSSGSGLGGWAATNSGLLSAFTRAVTATGKRLEGCYITVGSNDAAAGDVVSRDDHLAKMRTLIANVRNHTGQQALPILWSGSNRRPGNDPRAQQFDWIRWAENTIGDDANVTHVQTMDYDLSDGVHLNDGANGYPASMRRTCFQWGERLVGGAYRRGPKIARMVADGNDVIVTLEHRGSSDFTPAAGITGFTADAMINAVTRVSANQIRVACAAPPTWMRYLEGASPAIGTPVYGNTAQALPMTVEPFMALTASEGTAPDTTVPVMAGSISITGVTSSGATLAFQAATDNVGVAGYEYSINGGTSYVNAGLSRSLAVSGLTSATEYEVRVRAYDDAGNRSAPLSTSFTTLAEQPPAQDTIDGSKVSASRKVVFPGGTRVVVFGSQPGGVVPNAPYLEGGKWWIDKHPEDERFYVADISIDLAERGTTAVSVTAIVAGVTLLEQPVVQGKLIPVKLGGLAAGTVNSCTFRVTCANGERFDRTIWFRPQQGQWLREKDPDDQSFYVFDIGNDLADSNTTAAGATAIPVGVTELAQAQVQGRLVVVKLGGMSITADPTNYCKLRIDCANGERFYRTIHFTRVDN